jgi:hypothetical protein
MTDQSKEQKDTVARVMHEFKEGALQTPQGRMVKNRKQAVAIALREAGASRNEDEAANRRNLERTKRDERAKGE